MGYLFDKVSLMKLYNLKNLVRYNHRFRVHDETVAEHSYFVSLFTMKLCDYFKVDNETRIKALEYAIIHDVPEIEISDIPYPVKQLIPQLQSSLRNAEITVMSNILPDKTGLFVDMETGESNQSKSVRTIVKLADILSVFQYCFLEESLGNTHMREVFELSQERLFTLKDDCDKMFPGIEFPISLELGSDDNIKIKCEI